MSFVNLLRCPSVTSALGELMLVDPLQRKELGYFELRYKPTDSELQHGAHSDTPSFRPYFRYNVDISDSSSAYSKIFLIEQREERFKELKAFYRGLTIISPTRNYQLCRIHLPFGDPWVSPAFMS
jgi:hypothetical protein